jgi:hypothetical protein
MLTWKLPERQHAKVPSMSSWLLFCISFGHCLHRVPGRLLQQRWRLLLRRMPQRHVSKRHRRRLSKLPGWNICLVTGVNCLHR